MGLPIARRIAASGLRVRAFDPSAKALDALCADAGASSATSARDVADHCELVLVCLPSVEACEAASLGPLGLIEGSRIRHLVHLSTTGSACVRRIAASLSERGVSVLDAPVSGGPEKAAQGTMVTMMAGPLQSHRLAEPVLRACGSVIYLGPVTGAAQTMKIINGMVSRVNLAIGCEAMVMAARAGLDPALALAVLNEGTAQSDATRRKVPLALAGGQFGAALRIVQKDARLWLEEVDALGLPSHIGRSAFEVYDRVFRECDPEDDVLSVLGRIDAWAGGPLEGVTLSSDV